ncbi:sugar transferase [Anabaena sphaerica FACHB-251]|uniref:Sugar transferase n=1 Tax=Anabaena sphaerica FACHB-251 TaxID=2692883 RepID=A0A926WK04_9NOST|nr:sugar transferase [Anabaena sphaerica]MBD2295923.1 sugar transferase [Anabaena sphaerica FACHB-251]
MLQQSIPNFQLSEAALDLRAPLSSKIRKGGWWLRIFTLVSVDFTLLTIAWILAEYRAFWHGENFYSSMLITIFIQIGALAVQGTYEPGNKRHDYGNMIKTMIFAHGIILLVCILYQPIEDISRFTLIAFWFTSTSLICSGRFGVNLLLEYLRSKEKLGKNSIFIICSEDEREQIIGFIQKENRYKILGFSNSDSLDKSNRLETLEKINQLGATEVLVSWDAIKNRMFLCWLFQASGIMVHIVPMELKPIYRDTVFHNIGGMTCLSFVSPVLTGRDFWLKRVFDFCFSSLFLLSTFPIYIAIAIAIKLDSPGPIFYKQTRIGLSSQEFKVWKFRTMRTDADKMQKELEALNETKDGVLFKIKDDPRVTRVGKFLRRYSLDELPQLFNVVLGEMSLVGPRPLPTRDVDKFSERHFIRQEVLPGVTGMWQVSGRSDILDFDQVMKLDLRYIENWSLWLDFQILFKTVQVVLKKEGAY